ncbi:MAG: hypothetical protein ABFD54_11875 [Armatimonadota bacterium]|nr:penicillin-binding protein activator LpoB [bacterium]
MINGRTRLWLSLSLIAIISAMAVGSADAALFGLLKSKKKSATVTSSSSLVVFPFDKSASVNIPNTFGEDIASALRSMLSGNNKYWVYMFYDRLAPIKRAKEDASLKTQDVSAPFSEDRSKCLKLAQLLSADFYMSGSIEDYRFDSAKKTAQMTVAVELVNVRSGKPVKTLLVTGSTPQSAVSAEEEDMRALAAGDAVAKLKTQIINDEQSGKDSNEKAGATAIEEPAK